MSNLQLPTQLALSDLIELCCVCACSGTEHWKTQKLRDFNPIDKKWQTMEWASMIELFNEDQRRMPFLERWTEDHLYLNAKSMMRAQLARDVMDSQVAALFDEKAQQTGKTCWNSLSSYLRNTHELWNVSTEQSLPRCD